METGTSSTGNVLIESIEVIFALRLCSNDRIRYSGALCHCKFRFRSYCAFWNDFKIRVHNHNNLFHHTCRASSKKLFFGIFSFLGCNKRLDLAFLIDGSGSINSAGRGNFRRCIEFVKSVVSSLNVSPRHTRVGVVLFSSRAWLILDFYRSRSKAGVLSTISRIRYPRGGTRIGKALNFVLYRLFRRSRRALKVRAITNNLR